MSAIASAIVLAIVMVAALDPQKEVVMLAKEYAQPPVREVVEIHATMDARLYVKMVATILAKILAEVVVKAHVKLHVKAAAITLAISLATQDAKGLVY